MNAAWFDRVVLRRFLRVSHVAACISSRCKIAAYTMYLIHNLQYITIITFFSICFQGATTFRTGQHPRHAFPLLPWLLVV
jgi:hypothetical protein